MKTTKTKNGKGYKVTREDGAAFGVRQIIVGGKKVWSIENDVFEVTTAKTLGGAICDIAHAQSKVTGWKSEAARIAYAQALG